MTNFNFEYKDTFLRYKDSNGNQLDLNGSEVDRDLEERTEQNENDISALQHYFDSISIKEDASGAIASFTDGSDGIPVKELIVNIEPIQEGTGDPSPENVRPISGRTEVNIWREATYDTSAEPVFTIQLGQTVYGGTVDVVSGEMVVDRAMVDLGSLTWNHRTANRAWTTINGIKMPLPNAIPNAIAEKYVAVSTSTTLTANHFAILQNPNGNVVFYYDETNDPSGQLCYELAQPITVQLTPEQLTPEQLTTLLGQNYIWADSGNVSVNYVADTKLYIDSVITANSQNENSENEKSDVIKEEKKENE